MTKKKGYLRAMINRVYDDGGNSVTKGIVRGTTECDWNLLNDALLDWKQKGYIELLEDPQQGSDDDICLKVIEHIPPD